MNDTLELTLIYTVTIPTLLILLWFWRPRKTVRRTVWLTESMSFFNTSSNLQRSYWQSVSAQGESRL